MLFSNVLLLFRDCALSLAEGDIWGDIFPIHLSSLVLYKCIGKFECFADIISFSHLKNLSSSRVKIGSRPVLPWNYFEYRLRHLLIATLVVVTKEYSFFF